MTKAHEGSLFPFDRDYILPIDYQDIMIQCYWNAITGRGNKPLTNISTPIEDDKFGQVIAVEDGLTNLLKNSSLDTYTGTNGLADGWTQHLPSGITRTNSVDTSFKRALSSSIASQKVSITGNTNTVETTTSIIQDFSAGAGITFTYSIYYYTRDNLGVHLAAWFYDSNGTNIGGDTAFTTTKGATKGWQRISGQILTPAGTARVRFEPYITVPANTIGDIWFDDAQVEQRNWATSYYPTTRPIGEVSYSKDLFPQRNFTLNMWINHTGDTRFLQNDYKLFALGSDITKSRLTIWNYKPLSSTDSRKIIADFGNDTSGTRQYNDLDSSTPFKVNNWEMFTVTFDYSTKTFTFYRNGVFWEQATTTFIHPITSVMLQNSGWKYSNILISPRVMTYTEIQTIYHYGKPLYDPYDYYGVFA